MADTRTRLMDAARDTVRESGLSGASARAIAARADANQALIFYHFHSVSELLEAASLEAVAESVEHHRAAFAQVRTLGELLTVGRSLHERERANGNVAVMAQLMAGAQHDPVLARAASRGMERWTASVRDVVERVLAGHPLADVLDADALAHAIAAGFIGLELYDGVNPAGAAHAMSGLETLGRLVDVVDGLGPLGSRAVRTALRSTIAPS